MAGVDPAKLPDAERTAFLATESAVIGKAYLGIAAILIVVAVFFWWRRAQLPANREKAKTAREAEKAEAKLREAYNL